ncbi:MAG: hypothetical protein C0502_02140 [Opitutus sp.]|nr:hypothetical protein [Opitutus sp.]
MKQQIDSDSLAGIRLLVVDDVWEIREILKLSFERLGGVVEMAAEAEAALALASPGRWDVAILDIDLPGIDGMELLGQLRGRMEEPLLPALFISGHADTARHRRVATLGFSLLLPKPFGLDEIAARVKWLHETRARIGSPQDWSPHRTRWATRHGPLR